MSVKTLQVHKEVDEVGQRPPWTASAFQSQSKFAASVLILVSVRRKLRSLMRNYTWLLVILIASEDGE